MTSSVRYISVFLSLLFILHPKAKAYDSDTHLRMTYAAARMVGINHEVSLMLAMSDQWNDVSALTTPMGSLVIGTRLRRLFHFPASRSIGIDNASESHGSLNLNTLTKTYRLDPMGSELIMEGMRLGFLPFVGNGLHTLQDTFGHEGYAAEVGHAYAGHDPDRAWRDWPKYQQMSLAVIRALISIRELLPPEALDFETLKQKQLWNERVDKNNAEQITQIFLSKVEALVTNDIFKDRRYTQPATRYILGRLKEKGIILSHVDVNALVRENDFDGEKDLHQIFEQIIYAVTKREVAGEEILKKEFLLADILRGYPLDSRKNIFQQLVTYPKDIQKNITNRIVMIVLDKYVPDSQGVTSLGFTNNFIYEPNNKLRELEMQIRMDDWRRLTAQMYGSNWYFVEPEPSLMKKVLRSTSVDFYRLVKKGLLAAKRKALGQEEPKDIVGVAEQELAKELLEYRSMASDVSFVSMPQKMARRWVRMLITFTWLDMLRGKTRFVPQENAMAWMFVDKVKELLEKGHIKPIIESHEVTQLVDAVVMDRSKAMNQLNLVERPTLSSTMLCKQALAGY